MKNIILLFSMLLIMSIQLSANPDTLKTASITTYWTESTLGNSAALSQPGYIYATTTIADTLKTTTATLISPVFGEQSSTDMAHRYSKTKARNLFSGKKILVGINVTTAYSDVVATLILEGSGDGVAWTTIATAIADCTPNVTGVTWAVADLTSTYLPF
jgi:hypothetical protein